MWEKLFTYIENSKESLQIMLILIWNFRISVKRINFFNLYLYFQQQSHKSDAFGLQIRK